VYQDKKLLARIKRFRGQVDAIERSLGSVDTARHYSASVERVPDRTNRGSHESGTSLQSFLYAKETAFDESKI
jgi:hypothetical protein